MSSPTFFDEEEFSPVYDLSQYGQDLELFLANVNDGGAQDTSATRQLVKVGQTNYKDTTIFRSQAFGGNGTLTLTYSYLFDLPIWALSFRPTMIAGIDLNAGATATLSVRVRANFRVNGVNESDFYDRTISIAGLPAGAGVPHQKRLYEFDPMSLRKALSNYTLLVLTIEVTSLVTAGPPGSTVYLLMNLLNEMKSSILMHVQPHPNRTDLLYSRGLV